MTTYLPLPSARRTPGSVVLARTALIAQTVIGYATSAMLAFIAWLGVAWTTSDGGLTPAAVGFVAAALFSVGVTVTMTVLTAGLRAGAANTRTALLVLEVAVSAVMIGVLTLSSSWELEGLVVAPTVYLACGVVAAIALTTRTARDWSLATR